MSETVTEQKTVKKVVRPETATLEYEVLLRTQREVFQKVIWSVMGVMIVVLGIYAMLGGSNPFLP